MFSTLKKGLGLFYDTPSRVLRFGLNNALRPFLKDELQRDNFELQFWKGVVRIKSLELDEKVLNQKLNDTVPFSICQATVDSLEMDVQWRQTNEGIKVRVEGTKLYLFLDEDEKENKEEEEEMENSMYYSLSSSMAHSAILSQSAVSEELLANEADESLKSSEAEKDHDEMRSKTVEDLFQLKFSKMELDLSNTKIVIQKGEDCVVSFYVGKIHISNCERMAHNRVFKKQVRFEEVRLDIVKPHSIQGSILQIKEPNFIYLGYEQNSNNNIINLIIDALIHNGKIESTLSPVQVQFLKTFFESLSNKSSPADTQFPNVLHFSDYHPTFSFSSPPSSIESETKSNPLSAPGFNVSFYLNAPSWPPDAVAQWLQHNKIPCDKVEINGEELLNLEPEELITTLGITDPKHRHHLLEITSNLQQIYKIQHSILQPTSSSIGTKFHVSIHSLFCSLKDQIQVDFTLKSLQLGYQDKLFDFSFDQFQISEKNEKENPKEEILIQMNKLFPNSKALVGKVDLNTGMKLTKENLLFFQKTMNENFNSNLENILNIFVDIQEISVLFDLPSFNRIIPILKSITENPSSSSSNVPSSQKNPGEFSHQNSLIKIKSPNCRLKLKFPSSKLNIGLELQEIIISQEHTSMDIAMWSLQFNKLQAYIEDVISNLESSNSTFKKSNLLEIFTLEEFNFPRLNFIFPTRYNPKYTIPVMMTNLEEVFKPENVILSYQAKNCDQIISLSIEPFHNVHHVNQLSSSIMDIVFPSISVHLEKKQLKRLLELSKLIDMGPNTSSSSIMISIDEINVELRDEEFASFGGNHATRFSLNMEGLKAFYATVVNSQALTSLISRKAPVSASLLYLNVNNFELRDCNAEILFQRTPQKFQALDERSSSSFFLNVNKHVIIVDLDQFIIRETFFWLKLVSYQEFYKYINSILSGESSNNSAVNKTGEEMKKSSNSQVISASRQKLRTSSNSVPINNNAPVKSKVVLIFENIVLGYQGKPNLKIVGNLSVPPCTIFHSSIIKTTLENQQVIIVNDFRMYLKEDFHIQKNKDTIINLRDSQFNYETFGFVRTAYTNTIVIEIIPENQKKKININFLAGKEQNHFVIELHSDSFQTCLRSFSALSQDLQFEISRLQSLPSSTSKPNSSLDQDLTLSSSVHLKGKEELTISELSSSLYSSSPNFSNKPPITKKETPMKDETVLFDESEDNPNDEKLEEYGADFHFVEGENPIDLNAEPEEVIFSPKIPVATSIQILNLILVWKLLGGKVWTQLEFKENDENVASQWDHSSLSVSLTINSLNVLFFSPDQTAQWRVSLDASIYIHDHVKFSRNRRLLNCKEDKYYPKTIRIILEQGSYYSHIPPSFKLKISLPVLRSSIDQDTFNFFLDYFTYCLDSSLELSQIEKSTSVEEETNSDRILFEYFEIGKIKAIIDYKPKNSIGRAIRSIRLGSSLWVIAISSFQADRAKLALRGFTLKQVKSTDQLLESVKSIWTPDVTSQLYKVLAGTRLGQSIKFALNVGGGFVDFVKIPIHEYQRGGSVLKGIGMGTTSLASRLTKEIANLLATGSIVVQKGITGLNRAITPQEENERRFSPYAHPPASIGEGFVQAVSEVTNHTKEGFQKATSGDVRSIPNLLTQPLVGVVSGVSKIFLGVRNTIDPESYQDATEKYKDPYESED